MEQQLEKPVNVILTLPVLQKMIEWSRRTERQVLKEDAEFWTSDQYYMLQCLKLDNWMKRLEKKPEQTLTIKVSSQVSCLIGWFINRYSTKQSL